MGSTLQLLKEQAFGLFYGSHSGSKRCQSHLGTPKTEFACGRRVFHFTAERNLLSAAKNGEETVGRYWLKPVGPLFEPQRGPGLRQRALRISPRAGIAGQAAKAAARVS